MRYEVSGTTMQTVSIDLERGERFSWRMGARHAGRRPLMEYEQGPLDV